jgi:hypothetical protein
MSLSYSFSFPSDLHIDDESKLGLFCDCAVHPPRTMTGVVRFTRQNCDAGAPIQASLEQHCPNRNPENLKQHWLETCGHLAPFAIELSEQAVHIKVCVAVTHRS